MKHYALGFSLLLAFLPLQAAEAVRPFVTDDARIIDYGQVEMETWTEFSRSPGDSSVAQHIMAGVTLTDWLEIIAGGGIGMDQTGLTISNPALQSKILFSPIQDNGLPGLAMATGLTFPVGQGALYSDATGLFAMGMATSSFWDEWLLVHLNLGLAGAIEAQRFSPRFYWGLGIDAGLVHPDVRLIAEVYAGDPLDAIAAPYAMQTGLRWLYSEHLNFDLTVGLQPEIGSSHANAFEVWGQLGIRILWDVFTRDGQPGTAAGARGMCIFSGCH